MQLKKDPRCYTDVCLRGKWFHYDHCTTNAFILKGGSSPSFKLPHIPETEDELINLLADQFGYKATDY